MNKYYNPVRTYQGYGSISILPDIISEMSLKRKEILFLVWNNGVCENRNLKEALDKLSDYHCCFTEFSVSNPEAEDLFALYRDTKNWKPEVIVAIGGGSVLDMGKSLCCLYGNEMENENVLVRAIEEKSLQKCSCRWIGIPTTAGTGSEVTCWATIWHSAANRKLSLERSDNYAYAAIVDPQFALTMPAKLAVSSALDAVAHATESYWSKASNLISRSYACQAISIIMKNIGDLMDKERSAQAHDAMAKGSLLAGMAFSNTKTTACHSLSYPLTMHYHIPHGVAVSMLLAQVMKKNLPYIKDSERLFEAYDIKSVEELEERLSVIFDSADICHRLKCWGVHEEEVSLLAKQSITKGRIDNNPVDLSETEIEEILHTIY